MRSHHLLLTPAFLLAALGAVVAVPGRSHALTAELLRGPSGTASTDWSGQAVAGSLDFNSDGYPDLVVGAPNAGGSDGKVYIHFGGPSADEVTDLTIAGLSTDYLGWALGAAGDVNGDGHDDLIVGALDCCVYAGLAYVYFGGPSPNTLADLTLTGAAADDLFGYSVAGAGDVNGDGYDDVVVSAPQNDGAGSNAGRVYIYFGGAVPDATADLVISGANPGDEIGNSVSGAGDVNGDGYADIVVGAWSVDVPGAYAGRAWVYFGGSSPNTVADLILTGGPGDLLGDAVSGAGDMNGDGYDDVLVGAPRYASGGVTVGRAYVLFGGFLPNSVPDLVFTGASKDSLGSAVAALGDVDGDGYADIAVGAARWYNAGSGPGRVYVYRGGPTPDTAADLVITGEENGDQFGFAVAGAGDVDGDGDHDLLVGAPTNDTGFTAAGRAYVYALQGYRLLSPNGGDQWVTGRPAAVRWIGRELTDIAVSADAGATWATVAEDAGGGLENSFTLFAPDLPSESALVRIRMSGQALSPSSTEVSDARFRIVPPHRAPLAAHPRQETITGEVLSDMFGGGVAGAGDVNGDGYDDQLVGASGNDGGGSGAGRAYLFLGGPGADTAPDATLSGLAAGDGLGAINSLAGVGDVNGDGYEDWMAGALGNDAGASNAGAAYLCLGGPVPDGVVDLTMLGSAASDNFGVVSGAGDVNGDGYDDWIVGASLNDAGAANGGAAYLYLGAPSPDSVADLTLLGALTSDMLGSSVAGAGDVNGDGYHDWIVGIPGDDAGGPQAGRAAVYFGGDAPDGTPDLLFTGEAAGDNFGIAVAGAGDVDGDGYGDLMVGANFHDSGGSSAGRAYVFLGGPGADAQADVVVTGERPGDNLGLAVAGAGDVNGDGYDDVLAGAYSNDAAGGSAGRAYLLYGGPGADSLVDAVFSGAALEQLGYAVAGAGDRNGDGFADLLLGARQSAPGAGPGRAFIHESARYVLESPSAAQTWNVGALEDVSWLGAEPADLWLSVDGGASYALLEEEVGGAPRNTISLRVPHQPTRFARLRLTPHDIDVSGAAATDSLFAIEASIALLNLKADPVAGGGVLLTWETDPGPDDLSGYRLERSERSNAWSVVAPLLHETSFHDPGGRAGMRYRLSGVNGLGQELLLGEIGLVPRAALAAWPLPYRGGRLHVSFLTAGGLAGRPARAEVVLFDAAGRIVQRIADGSFEAGEGTASWDGRDESGRAVPNGIYFLRAVSGGTSTTVKIAVRR